MLRRFSRINSVPHYHLQCLNVSNNDNDNDNTSSKTETIKEDNDISRVFIHPHAEYQYLNLINDIIEQNNEQVGRNGSTFSVFGAGMVFSLEQGWIPILTTKKMAWKTCLKELLWFIQGKTDNRLLQDVGVSRITPKAILVPFTVTNGDTLMRNMRITKQITLGKVWINLPRLFGV
jgi:hypothetical protein